MPDKIDRIQLQDLMKAGAQAIDVLPEDEYDEEHIPGAINIPLKKLGPETAGRLDKRRPEKAPAGGSINGTQIRRKADVSSDNFNGRQTNSRQELSRGSG